MKRSLSINEFANKIQSFANDLGGVFTFSDLWNIIGLNSSDRLSKVLTILIREKVLFKIKRNLYTTQSPDLWRLASQWKQKSYISMDSVLSKNGLVGTIPRYSVSVVYHGPPQKVETPFGLLRFFMIKQDLLFGFTKDSHGTSIADNEKAYIDLLYYYNKGSRFVMDPLKEVDVSKLDRKKIAAYLTHYKNKKFITFVERMLDEQA